MRGSAPATCGWYTDTLVSTLCLEDTALLVEERRIVAVTDTLTELRIPADAFPGPVATDVPIGVRVVYGGDLIDSPGGRLTRRSVRIRLPTSLARGRGHQYGLASSAAVPASSIHQHIHNCTQRCDLYVARARFGLPGRPSLVWLVDGETPDQVAAPACRRQTIPVDSVGEVVARFQELEPGRCYGFRW